MNRLVILCLMYFILFSCQKKKENSNKNIQTLNYEQLKPLLHQNTNKTYVVNFWATWCVPCVKELPAFEKLYDNYKSKNVEVILVSLDFSKQKESVLVPFVTENNLQPKVLHFFDANEQFWIQDISGNWTGSIPATLIYNAKKRKFYEQTFHYEELKQELETFLN